ncbi:MAG: methylmalonyl-CoA mutase family protein [Putridiphycobacter sp.]
MASNTTNLFAEFTKVSEKEWLEKIEKDLKGKPLSILDYSPELNIETKAYFHSENANNYSPVFPADGNDWYIQEKFLVENEKATNQKILDSLMKGCNALQVELDDPVNVSALLKSVELKYISAEFVLKTTGNLDALINEIGEGHEALKISYSALTNGIENGKFNSTLADFFDFYEKSKLIKGKNIHVNGSVFGKGGASTIHELAVSLALLSEYTQYLLEQGEDLKTISSRLYTTLSVNEEYFTNIAKFRAYKILLSHFFKSFDENFELSDLDIIGVTNVRHLAKNDKNNNLLRATTQCMSAVLGGCKTIQVTPFEKDNKLAERMARNIQLVLKEEAFFDKVSDPGAGSYYIENLTDQLVEKSWALFIEIENAGGYLNAMNQNFIQNLIEENKKTLIDQMNTNQKTFLGVNKYPSTLETWQEVSAPADKMQDFKAVSVFVLEDYYQKTTDHE